MEKRKILCVCAGNTCRSPMIAAFLQRELGDEFQVESAGWYKNQKGEPASPDAVAVMRTVGIDISEHVARWIGELNVDEFDYFVCATPALADSVLKIVTRRLVRIIGLNIPDPYGKGLLAYRNCLAAIDQIVLRLATGIKSC